GAGIPTTGVAPTSIESSRVFSTQVAWAAGPPAVGGGGYFTQVGPPGEIRDRTFYARYWTPSALTRPNANTIAFQTAGAAPASGPTPWNQGFGDEREPLGLRYAARYFEGNGTTSYIRVWRASSKSLTNLSGSNCTAIEPTVNLSFYDEDENSIVPAGQPPCPSPCSIPPPSTQNFPLETQRVRVQGNFTLPAAFAGANVGWVSLSFVNLCSTVANFGGLLDQAHVDYEFRGAGAFVNASVPGAQLDPSSCRPLTIDAAPATVGTIACNVPGGLCPTITNGILGEIVTPDVLTDPITPGGATATLLNPPVGK